MNRAIGIFLVSLVLIIGPTRAGAQLFSDLPREAIDFQGCWHLETQDDPAWLARIERRIHLTATEMTPAFVTSRPAFVARAAPGTEASWYPSVSWILVRSSTTLQITWAWPGFEWVWARFELEDDTRRDEYIGTVEFSSDDLTNQDQWYPVPARLKRIDC